MNLSRNVMLRDAVDASRRFAGLMTPRGRAAERSLRIKRDETDGLLARLCGTPATPFDGEVLIDAQWDNPNYWLRACLLRAALGLPNGRETGLTGRYRARECARTMTRLGITRRQSFDAIAVDKTEIARTADRLLEATRTASDMFDWALRGGVPGAMIYDAILKRQRLATVDVRRGDFRPLVIEALCAIARAARFLDEHDFRLAVISHPVGFTYGSLAYQALARGIPVILPFGLFGVLRMTHMFQPKDLTRFYDRPSRAEMDSLLPARADALESVGRRYLEGRFGGKADDLASLYAFQRACTTPDRAALCDRFGWDPTKPIVGFYASNWFDWPHQLGMTQFRDFLDWTEASFAAAGETPRFNWLFKPHPCEDWFGGIRLRDILAQLNRPAHVAIAQKDWNNAAVMRALDALVTYHGTAGIEFASLGKPVLVPDRGKYDDCGFVKLARDRADYLRLLRKPWWEGMDLAEVKRRAELFAGWWFCAPEWQDGFILGDDGQTNGLYDRIPALVEGHAAVVRREIEALRAWYESGERYSHTFKMKTAESYKLSNVG